MLPSFYLIERDLWLLLGETFFAWWNVIYIFYIFLFTYSPYAYIFCIASAFPRTTEHTTMRFMLQTVRPFRKCWFWNIQSEEVMARYSSVRDLWGCQSVYLSQSFGPRTQAKLWLYLMLSGNKFWFCLVPRWLPQVISFPIGLSPRTMQDLAFV